MTDRRFQAVVFDMDGLMFDTETLYIDILEHICRGWGRTFSPEVQRATAGLKNAESSALLVQLLEVDADPRQVHRDTIDRLKDRIAEELRPMPGLMPLLGRLREARYRLALATSSERELVDPMLAKFDLAPVFEVIQTAEDVEHGKPHPEIYETTAARLGLEPGQCVVLEDSVNGLTSAKASGAFSVLVPSPFVEADDLSDADLQVDSLAAPQLYALLGL